jgi:hypothetical protein
VRVVSALLGLVAIIIGLLYGIRVFDRIYSGLDDPAGFGGTIDEWAAALGGEDLDYPVGDRTVHTSKVVAVAVVGVGSFLPVWLALGIMAAGAKVVSWTATDKEAIRRMLKHVSGSLGPTSKKADEQGQ